MKRVLSLLLIIPVLLLSFSFTIPVSAAETVGEYFNVLDYTGVNGTISSSVTIDSPGIVTFDLSPFFGDFAAYNYELVIQVSGTAESPVNSIRFGSYSSTPTGGYMDDNVFRYRGSFDGAVSNLFTLYLNTFREITINFVSFNVYTVSTNFEPISGSVVTSTNRYLFSAGSGVEFTGTSEYNVSSSLTVSFDNWRSFDYIQFSAAALVSSVNSITAFLVSNVDGSKIYDIPIRISDYSLSNPGFLYVFNVSVDLTGFDHVFPDDSYLAVNFSYITPKGDYAFKIYSANGIFLKGSVNTEMKWYQVFYYTILDSFNTLYNYILDFSDSVSSNFDSWFTSLSGWIDSSTQAISSKFDSWFSSLQSWINSSTDRIIAKMEDLLKVDSDDGNKLNNSINNFFGLLDGLGDFNGMLGLDPDSMQNTLPILSITPPDFSNSKITNFFTVVYSQPLIESYLIFGFTIALIGFVLFGKR